MNFFVAKDATYTITLWAKSAFTERDIDKWAADRKWRVRERMAGSGPGDTANRPPPGFERWTLNASQAADNIVPDETETQAIGIVAMEQQEPAPPPSLLMKAAPWAAALGVLVGGVWWATRGAR